MKIPPVAGKTAWTAWGRCWLHSVPTKQIVLCSDIDEQLRSASDTPSIDLLLCKSKDRLVTEYALSYIYKPLGLASYTLPHTLPEDLRGKLPSIEELEAELANGALPEQPDVEDGV